jgi:hypothetical protein
LPKDKFDAPQSDGGVIESFQTAVAFVLIVILTFLFVSSEASNYGKRSPTLRRRLWQVLGKHHTASAKPDD